MRSRKFMCPVFAAVVVLLFIATGCNKASETIAASASGGKIPITTKSEEAKKEFIEGRDLFEKLQIHSSVAHFDKALSLDPDFAAAELARANASPTAQEFFDHLNKAVAL